MTKRAMFLAAGAITAIAGQAEALTPLSIDASQPLSEQTALAPFASASPSAFIAPDIDPASFGPSLSSRGPRLQCVPFARRESGVEIYGDAYTWWRQAQARYETQSAPAERAVMVMRGYANPNRGHVAVVRRIVNSRIVIVDHANWLNRGEITRNVAVRDVSPNNDWSQVQVWYIPGGHWGARTYDVQGFILSQARGAAAAPGAEAAIS